jgi:hypothetical protein
MFVSPAVKLWLGVPLVIVGAAVAIGACGWLWRIEFGLARRDAPAVPILRPPMTPAWRWGLVAVMVVGLLVRVIGLTDRSMSHPEVYIPGLDLPAGISEPPPRHGFIETARYHFQEEPHPFGYYLAMWAWTKMFGATLTTIRMPEMILGAASVALIYLVGAWEYGAATGVVAAAMLALHGFHTYWSQLARMYVPGTFLGLLSTWLLLKMTETTRRRPGFELAYAATTVAGAMTLEFFTPFLCGQILWTALNHREPPNGRPRPAVIQALAFMLSAPMLLHGAMLGRNEAAGRPTLGFLEDFFSFGFLFHDGGFAPPTPKFFVVPVAVAIGVLLLAVAAMVVSVRSIRSSIRMERVPPPPRAPIYLCAAGMVLAMAGLALVAVGRHGTLMTLTALPLVALAIPPASGALRSALARFAPRVERLIEQWPGSTSLMPSLAVLPTLAIFLVSFKLTLIAPRASLIFVPYVLIGTAAGVVRAARTRAAAVAIAAVLVVLFTASNVLQRRVPLSERDYQDLAQQLNGRSEPTDLIFVRNRNWAYTPFYYYMDHTRLVAGDFEGAVRRAPHSRVWLPEFGDQHQSEEARRAVARYRIADRLYAAQVTATLYVPPQ